MDKDLFAGGRIIEDFPSQEGKSHPHRSYGFLRGCLRSIEKRVVDLKPSVRSIRSPIVGQLLAKLDVAAIRQPSEVVAQYSAQMRYFDGQLFTSLECRIGVVLGQDQGDQVIMGEIGEGYSIRASR